MEMVVFSILRPLEYHVKIIAKLRFNQSRQLFALLWRDIIGPKI
jgi:hypothetical protein